jgi:hypothetical protein
VAALGERDPCLVDAGSVGKIGLTPTAAPGTARMMAPTRWSSIPQDDEDDCLPGASRALRRRVSPLTDRTDVLS